MTRWKRQIVITKMDCCTSTSGSTPPPLKRPSKRVSKCDNPVVDAGASWHCGSGRLPWCWVFRLDPDRSPRFSLRDPSWAGTVANKTHNYKKRKEKIMIKEKKRKGKKEMANNSPNHRCSRAPPLILDPCTTRIIRSLILGPSHAQWRHRSVPTVPDYDPRPILLSLPPIELHHHRYCCGSDL